jgi:hypothetical protein
MQQRSARSQTPRPFRRPNSPKHPVAQYLTYPQLEALWQQAGGDPGVAPTAAAIALAESSGNPGAENPTDNNGQQTSWGLWQISDGTHNPFNDWSDPLTNAQAAVGKYVSAGNAFTPWGAYDSGAYRSYLYPSYPGGTPVAAPSGAAGDGNAGSASGPGGWLQSLVEASQGSAVGLGLSAGATSAQVQAGEDPLGIGAAIGGVETFTANLALQLVIAVLAIVLVIGGVLWAASANDLEVPSLGGAPSATPSGGNPLAKTAEEVALA